MKKISNSQVYDEVVVTDIGFSGSNMVLMVNKIMKTTSHWSRSARVTAKMKMTSALASKPVTRMTKWETPINSLGTRSVYDIAI